MVGEEAAATQHMLCVYIFADACLPVRSLDGSLGCSLVSVSLLRSFARLLEALTRLLARSQARWSGFY